MAAKSFSDASTSNGSAPFPPDPNSPQSTITTVVREIRDAGGDATAVAVDVRDQNSVEALVRKTIEVGDEHGRESALPPPQTLSCVSLFSPSFVCIFIYTREKMKQVAVNTHFSIPPDIPAPGRSNL